jgi:hypothetical protein
MCEMEQTAPINWDKKRRKSINVLFGIARSTGRISMESIAAPADVKAAFHKRHYDGLEKHVLSMVASDAALELSTTPAAYTNLREYSAERLADLLSACSSALRREHAEVAPTIWGKLLRRIGA